MFAKRSDILNGRVGTVLLLRAGLQAFRLHFFCACGSAGSWTCQVSVLSGVGIKSPHDGVRRAGVVMSSARSRRWEDPGRTGAHAIAATSPWQGQPSAGTRRNLSRSCQEAVTAASLFDQRNSVSSRHMQCKMTASLRATATVAF